MSDDCFSRKAAHRPFLAFVILAILVEEEIKAAMTDAKGQHRNDVESPIIRRNSSLMNKDGPKTELSNISHGIKKRSGWHGPPEYTKRLTENQRQYILAFHNLKRSEVQPPAANMKMLVWNAQLETMAMLRAAQCRIHSGRDELMNSDFSMDEEGHSALEGWWSGGHFYNMSTHICTENVSLEDANSPCEHYTRMLWADADSIGCGIERCDIYYSIACLYTPLTNVLGESPYKIGERCSLCNETTPFCYNKQCISKDQCTELRATECKCKLTCQNCGILDEEKCQCECSDGWDGADCSVPCRDEHPFCNRHPGYLNLSSCALEDYKVGYKYCRKMCGECKTLNLTGKKCCDGIICPFGEVLDLAKCSCKLFCPGPLCYGSAERIFPELWTIVLPFAVIWLLS